MNSVVSRENQLNEKSILIPTIKGLQFIFAEKLKQWTVWFQRKRKKLSIKVIIKEVM